MNPTGRILLVEDDDALREALREVLVDEGFGVECAANGPEALEQLDRNPAPDLIVLDLVMPVMDGWTFRDTQRMTPRLARIPTMVLSASFPPDSPRMRSLDAQAVLSKPVSIDRLLRAMQRLLPPPALRAAP